MQQMLASVSCRRKSLAGVIDVDVEKSFGSSSLKKKREKVSEVSPRTQCSVDRTAE